MVLSMELCTYRKHISNDLVTTGSQGMGVGEWESEREHNLQHFHIRDLSSDSFTFFFSEGLAKIQDEWLLCLKNYTLGIFNTSPANHYWM